MNDRRTIASLAGKLWQSLRNRSAYSLAIVLVLAAAIRFIQLGRESFWYDELYSAWARKLPLTELAPEVLAAGHPPLFNMIAHYWNVFGESDFQVRSLSALCGVVTVWLVYLLGKELYSRRAGLWASALAAFSPFLVWYSREATSYSWLVMVTTLSFLMLARSAKKGGWTNWAAYVAATAIAFFTHFLAVILIIPGFTIYWLMRNPASSRVRSWSISQALLMFALAAQFYLKRFVVINSDPSNIPSLRTVVHSLAAAPLSLVGGRIGNHISVGTSMFGFSRRALLALALALFVSAAALGVKKVRSQLVSGNTAALALFILLLVAAPVIMVASVDDTPVAARYFVWAEPAFILLLTVLATSIPSRLAVPVMTVIIVAFLATTLLGYRIENYDWRDIMQQVGTNKQNGDRMMCFPLHHCVVASSHYLPPGTDLVGGNLDISQPGSVYYTARDDPWAGYGHESEFSLLSGAELARRLNQDASGAARIWLVGGDGLAGEYPSANHELKLLEDQGWKEAGSWHYLPLTVTLLVR